MPFRFEFDREHRILLVLLEGEIRDSEVMTIKSVAASYLDRLRPAAAIADLSAMNIFHISGQTVRTAARQPSYVGAIPSYIVAPEDHLFGMARMYELAGAANLHVVRSREEALAALGVRNPKFEAVNLP